MTDATPTIHVCPVCHAAMRGPSLIHDLRRHPFERAPRIDAVGQVAAIWAHRNQQHAARVAEIDHEARMGYVERRRQVERRVRVRRAAP